jgi:hypothetical protein
VLYYILVTKPDSDDAPLPVAECLTNDHTTLNLCHFLKTFLRDYRRAGESDVLEKVEMDFSWALIHASMEAFNIRTDISSYMEKAMAAISGQKKFDSTVIHLCSAHVMHLFMKKIVKGFRDKEIQALLAKAMRCLETCQTPK